MNEGYVYILTNSSFQDDYLKIGKTRKTPEERAKQLSSTTSVPTTFKVAYSHKFRDCNKAERNIHEKLSEYRINDDREFFRCNLEIAIKAFNDLILENYKNNNEDLEKKIDILELEKKLNDKKLIKYNWDNFFERLGWNYSRNNDNPNFKIQPDFTIITNDWSDEPDEKYEKSILKISDVPTYVFIQENLPCTSNEINDIPIIKNIIKEFKNIQHKSRLCLVGASPLNNYSSIKLGWLFSSVNSSWGLISFVQHQDNLTPKYGILDDDRSWFCSIRGKFLNRENIHFDEELLFELWMKK